MIALESIFKGSKYSGATIEIFETIDGIDQPSDLSGADIIMQMTRNEIVHATYNTSNSTLMIDDNKIIIPGHTPNLDFGEYEFDFSLIMPNGDVFNGIAPGTWEILNPKTVRPTEQL